MYFKYAQQKFNALTAIKTGVKILKATIHSEIIVIIVLLGLNILRTVIGVLIAKYLSMLIAVIVKTEAATVTPEIYV